MHSSLVIVSDSELDFAGTAAGVDCAGDVGYGNRLGLLVIIPPYELGDSSKSLLIGGGSRVHGPSRQDQVDFFRNHLWNSCSDVHCHLLFPRAV
jgi:hypothetical protein